VNAEEKLFSRKKFLQTIAAAGSVGAAGLALSGSLINPVQATFADADPASYIIDNESGTINAYSGDTGKLVYTGTIAANVIQSAINALKNGGTIYIKAGTYSIATQLVLLANVSIIGEGRNATQLNSASTTLTMFSMANAVTRISDLSIGATVTMTSGSAILVTGSDCVIQRIRITGYFNGIDLEQGINYLEDIDIRNLTGTGTFAIKIGASTDQHLNQIEIAGDNGPNHTAYGIYVTKTGGLWMDNCDIVRCVIGMYLSAQNAATQSLDALFINSCAFDSNTNYGIAYDGAPLSTSTNHYYVNCWAVSNGLSGVSLVACENIRFIALKCWNNNQHGILIGGGTDWLIDSSTIADNNKSNAAGIDGIHIGSGVGNGLITGCRIGNGLGVTTTAGFQKYGVNYVGGGGYVMVSENDLRGNITGPILFGAADTGVFAKDNLGFNPQGVATITVTASPFTYTNNDSVPEAVYIDAGTVSAIAKNSITVYTSTGKMVWLEPGEAVTVTYSSTPTMNKDRK